MSSRNFEISFLGQIVVPLICSLIVYSILSLLLIPVHVSVPISVILFWLVFGLIRYYDSTGNSRSEESRSNGRPRSTVANAEYLLATGALIFAAIFAADLVVLLGHVFSESEIELFVPWGELTIVDIINAGAAIAASFFLPGYAIICIIDRKQELSQIPKIIIGVLLSMLITGITGYAYAGIYGVSVSEAKVYLLVIYFVILAIYVWKSNLLHRTAFQNFRFAAALFKVKIRSIKRNKYEILVFLTLFAFVIFFTYYLFGGTIIGDHWFHHGRSLLFLSGAFKDLAESEVDWLYPPFQSALYASFFSLSDLPTVNAYVSINFLNILPVLAFYYFFKKWVPVDRQRAALLATTLFLISSGFGWLYVTAVALAEHERVVSELSSLQLLFQGGIRTFDIRLPGTFVIGSHHPEFTTGLIIVGLPAGFTILGMIRERMDSRLIYGIIIACVAITGVLTHPEFFYFIIIATIVPILFNLIEKKNSLYIGLFSAVAIVSILDVLLPGSYLLPLEIAGFPLLPISILFILLMWFIYLLRARFTKPLKGFAQLSRMLDSRRKNPKLIRLLVLTLVVAYVYLFAVITWSTVPTFVIQVQTSNLGQREIPWYIFPVKLGVTGILGVGFLISYAYRKFEKEILVFGIMIIVALFMGPYYDEHRFSKYILVGMSALASLLIYELIRSLQKRGDSATVIGAFLMGVTIMTAGLSTFISAGYNAIAMNNPAESEMAPGRIYFPRSEISMLNFLYQAAYNSSDYNVSILPEQGLHFGLLPQIEGFSGIPRSKLLQNPLTLNSTTLEGFYDLIKNTNTGLIVIPRAASDDRSTFPPPLTFALEHFPKVYTDSKYMILRVPSLTPPSKGSDNVAVVFQKEGTLFSGIINSTSLQYDGSQYPSIVSDPKLVVDDETYMVMHGPLWSRQMNEEINYLETSFRILGEPTYWNEAGLRWIDNLNHENYVYLDNLSLKYLRKSLTYPYEYQLQEIRGIGLREGFWYDLKVVLFKDAINVYINDLFKIKMPILESEANNATVPLVTKTGISAYNTLAEFKPVVTGKFQVDMTTESYERDHLYPRHYYPLTTLALADTEYDVFMEDDLSIFGSKNIVLTYDPMERHIQPKLYQDFVINGGNLFIFLDSKDFNSKLRIGEAYTNTGLNHDVEEEKYEPLNGLSIARNSDINLENQSIEIFSTLNESSQAQPIAYEGELGRGKIMVVNIEKMFPHLISPGNNSRFDYLYNSTSSIGALGLNNQERIPQDTMNDSPLPFTRFLGTLNVVGNFNAYASTISLGEQISDYGLNIGEISFTDIRNAQDVLVKNQYAKDLLFYGGYSVNISSVSSSQPIIIPSGTSQYDNVEILLPPGFDIDMKLSRDAAVEILGRNNTLHHLNADEGMIDELHFRNITLSPSFASSIPVVLKSPEIGLIGNASFEKLYPTVIFDSDNLDRSLLQQIERETDEYAPYSSGGPVDISGALNMKIDLVDTFLNPNGPYIDYITYIEDLEIANKLIEQKGIGIQLPFDISERAKQSETFISLEDAFFSSTNLLVLMILMIFGGLATTDFLWRDKIRRFKKL